MRHEMSWKGVQCPYEPATSKTLKKIIEKNRARPDIYYGTQASGEYLLLNASIC